MKEFKIEVPEGCKPTNIKVDGNVISYEVEEVKKFEPKDGDILYCGCVFIYNPNIVYDNPLKNGYYISLGDDGSINTQGAPYFCGYKSSARYATKEQAQQLFDALAKEGKRWNAETKQIETINRTKIKIGIDASENGVREICGNIKDGRRVFFPLYISNMEYIGYLMLFYAIYCIFFIVYLEDTL